MPAARTSAWSPKTDDVETPAESGVNWFRTWIGHTQSDPASRPSAPSQHGRWLSQLPFQNQFGRDATELSIAEKSTAEEPEPSPDPEPAQRSAPVEEETEPIAEDDEPVTAAPVAAPVSTTPTPSEQATVAEAAGELSPLTPRQQMESQQTSETPPAPPPDKGELIWAAEFVVGEVAPEALATEESPLSAETVSAARRENNDRRV